MDNYYKSEEFHNLPKVQKIPVYNKKLGWAINKKKEHMTRVLYEPTHPNPDFSDFRAGQGKNFATWLFSEQKDTAENIFSNSLDAVIRARFEPHASVGYHSHHSTEEIYIILKGSLTMTTVDPETGEEHEETLEEGDAHVVKTGQAHYGIAGTEGVEFLSIIVKATNGTN